MNRKPIFDLVRRWLGRGLRQSEVIALDEALDGFVQNAVPCVPEYPPKHPPAFARHTIGPAGIALIKRFEGCAKKRADGMIAAYPDPGTGADPWTIGWGATGTGIGPDSVWSQAQCDARLESDLKRYAAQVAAALENAPTTQAQFDALVSFHYNTGAIRTATLTQKHRAGDYEEAAAEFARWKFAGGRVLKGLQRRREAEARLYRGKA